RDQSMVVGFGEGAGVVVIRPGSKRAAAVGHLSATIASVAEDPSGVLWAATDRGVFRFSNGAWTRVPFDVDDVDARAFTLAIDAHGTVSAGTSAGLFQLTGSHQFQP